MSKVYVVGPVGSRQDLTLRARDMLCRARLVIVHDERLARSYLDDAGVHAQLLESSREEALTTILNALSLGEVAWLVVELDELAGPAHRLMRALLARNIELLSVPGASAVVSGLVASGLPADRFTACGVLPGSRAERLALWTRLAHDPLTIVCQVRSTELAAVLSEVETHLGDRRIAVCKGDNVWRGPVRHGKTLGWEGVVTLVIDGASSEPDWTRERVLEEIRALLDAGTSSRDVSREIARRSGWPKREVYEMALRASRDED